ncbi:MAG: hypothetical protein ACXIVO_10770 [Glycocaulis sp.]|uniref:hypothetical protein n=1 Tax=Glycocaulis sp. TaxID=1969725 RepID=UPI003F730475
MKRILVTTVVIASFAGAAHAQLPDLTGQVTGTVNQTTDARLGLLGSEAMIDQRTGLGIDTRLTGQLDRALPRHDRMAANAALRTQLETESHAYVRASAPPPRARASARVEYAPVRVYTRDGYYVGHVHRTRRSSGQYYVVIRPQGASRTHAVLASHAAFDASANAVVLAATQAELNSQLNIHR